MLLTETVVPLNKSVQLETYSNLAAALDGFLERFSAVIFRDQRCLQYIISGAQPVSFPCQWKKVEILRNLKKYWRGS